MVSTGLIVRVEARAGKDAQVESFLTDAVAAVAEEPGTTAWFGIRFGRSEYGIVDVFPDEDSRTAHLEGPVAAQLTSEVGELFVGDPEIEHVDVLAHKLPQADTSHELRKGILLELPADPDARDDMEQFLRDAQAIAEEEPGTVAWFALRLGDARYAIFDVFEDDGARFAHLTGQVPRQLATKAVSLLDGFPDLNLLDVVATELA